MLLFIYDRDTESIANHKYVRTFSKEIQRQALRKITLMEAAQTIEDLKVPPGNRFEYLKGDLEGYCSIRVNNQYRLIFKIISKPDEIYLDEVKLTDYHR